MADVDIESELVAHFKPVLDELGAAGVGPEMRPDSPLPFIQVTALPATQELQSWDGRLSLDRLDADVDVYAAKKATARDVGQAVRARLAVPLASRAATISRRPALTPRPDRNENVRRYGAAVSFLARS